MSKVTLPEVEVELQPYRAGEEENRVSKDTCIWIAEVCFVEWKIFWISFKYMMEGQE